FLAVAVPGPPGPPGEPGLPGTRNLVTTFRNIDDMLQRVHLVTEGTLLYLSENSEVLIRVRDGWRKLQVLIQMCPIPRFLLPPSTDLLSLLSLRLHLVALNTAHSGNVRADYQCFQQARAAGLTSTYRAFLSSHLQDLSTVVRKADRYSLPIVNLKGETLFQNWESIFSGNGGQFNFQVPIYSFEGRNVLTDPSWPQKVIWHGSSMHGTRLVSNYCEAWRTADMAVMGQASRLKTGKLLDQQAYSCSNKFIVLCVENSFISDIRSK
uniref:Collagen alpha-1(XV) chain n=1 Tax=Sphenodon punctatus TaxID=8508 RepID=A0A8D0G7X3_SPHPU